jgi:hypothetical protein
MPPKPNGNKPVMGEPAPVMGDIEVAPPRPTMGSVSVATPKKK